MRRVGSVNFAPTLGCRSNCSTTLGNFSAAVGQLRGIAGGDLYLSGRVPSNCSAPLGYMYISAIPGLSGHAAIIRPASTSVGIASDARRDPKCLCAAGAGTRALPIAPTTATMRKHDPAPRQRCARALFRSGSTPTPRCQWSLQALFEKQHVALRFGRSGKRGNDHVGKGAKKGKENGMKHKVKLGRSGAGALLKPNDMRISANLQRRLCSSPTLGRWPRRLAIGEDMAWRPRARMAKCYAECMALCK